MTTSSSGTRLRRGQLLIIAPAVLLCFCGMAALCVDFGHFVTTAARLQASADAAALASVLELWDQRGQGDSADETAHRNFAETEGVAINALNESLSRAEVVFGVWDGGSFTPVNHTIAANAARVRAIRDENAPGGRVGAVFAQMLGVESVVEGRQAVARFTHPKLVPVAVDEDALVPPGESLVMYDDTETVPGNCGLLDFDGGDNSANDTKDWVRNGYEGPFYIDPAVGYLDVPGCTGLQSSITPSLNYHISDGDVIVILIYRSVTGVGSLAEYTLVGYAAAVITGYEEEDEELLSVTATLLGTYFVDSGETEGELTGFMLLQLVE